MPFMTAVGDPLAWLGALPSEVVDGVVVDAGPAPVRVEKRPAAGSPMAEPGAGGAEASASEAVVPAAPAALAPAPQAALAPATPNDLALKHGPLAFQVFRVLRPGRRVLWLCRQGEWAAVAALAARLRFEIGQPIVWEQGPERRRQVILILTKPGAAGAADAAQDWPRHDWIMTPDDDGDLPEVIAEVLVASATFPGEWLLDPLAAGPQLGMAALRAGRGYGCNVRDARRVRVVTAALEGTGAVRAIVSPYGIGSARATAQLTIFGDDVSDHGGFGSGLGDGTRLRAGAAQADGLR